MSGSYYFALVGGGDRPLLELEFNHKKEKDQRMVFLNLQKIQNAITSNILRNIPHKTLLKNVI